MRYLIAILGIILIFVASGCSTSSLPSKTISISGAIEVPIPVNSERYWVDDGPLFVAKKEPLITYRVIDKNELEFSGTEKSVYDFFASSFSNPDGVVEKSFRDSHDSYAYRKKSKNGMDFYIFSKTNESKAYIVSGSMTVSVEVQVTGKEAASIVDGILEKARLTKGD